MIDNGLFRKQALENYSNRLHGEILILPRASHTMIIGFIVVWVASFLAWAAFSSYAKKETVMGWIEPKGGVTRVYANNGGIIKSKLIEEGQLVEEGQPLFEIHRNSLLENGGDIDSALITEYTKQSNILIEQIGRSKKIYEQRKKSIESRIQSARQSIDILERQIIISKKRHEIQENFLYRIKKLDKYGHVSEIQIDEAKSRMLEAETDLSEALVTKENVKNSKEILEQDLSILDEEIAIEIDSLEARLSVIATQTTQIEGQRTQIIRASRPGIVTNIQGHEGQSVVAGDGKPLAIIGSEESELEIRLLVPARSAGFLEIGQTIDIRYDAFPYQKFGLYRGELTKVSALLILPNELKNVPFVIQEPVYSITARVLSQSVSAYGKEIPIKGGMLLSADIRLSERSVLQWFLDPIYSLKGRI